MSKEKALMNLKLSELIEQSLSLGVVPIIKFFDKDKADVAGVLPPVPLTEETPIIILEKQIDFYRRMVTRLDTKKGIDVSSEGAEERCISLSAQLQKKIIEFENAIVLLNKEQNVQASVATEADSTTKAD